MWCTDLVAPQHVGSSWTRDRTCVPCIGRQILNHCANREVTHHCIFLVLNLEDPKTVSTNTPEKRIRIQINCKEAASLLGCWL